MTEDKPNPALKAALGKNVEEKIERYEASFAKEVLKHLGMNKKEYEAKIDSVLAGGGGLGPTFLADEYGPYWGNGAVFCTRVAFSWESLLSGKFPGYEIWSNERDKLSENGSYDAATRAILVFRFDPVKFMVMFDEQFGIPHGVGTIRYNNFCICTLKDYLSAFYPVTR